MPAPPATTAADKAALIAEACKDAKATSTGWQACCPAHEDSHPSLSIGYEGDKVLLHCHAGCSVEAICAALMITVANLFCGEKKGKLPFVAIYDYVDEGGTLLFQVVRLSNHTFPQRRPDPIHPGKWIWNLTGVRRVLYHLPEVLAGLAHGDPVWIAEGEKDVDSLRALGLTATCNPMGGENWKDDSYDQMLQGATCYLLPDHDDKGTRHVTLVAHRLAAVGASVKIIPGIHTTKKGSDVSDWLTAGHTIDELLAAANATPPWTPGPIAFAAAAPPGTNGTHPPAPPTPGTLPPPFDPSTMYTDTYNARAFADDHWLNVRYCSAWKTWLLWNGTHWERDADGTVMQWAKHTIKHLATLLHGMDNDQSKALLSHIARSLSTAKLEAMLKSARSEPGIPVKPDAFDRHLWLLNSANGTIDLHTGTLRPAARDDYLTRCLSVRYNPKATCPTWEKFLDRAMDGKQGLVAFLHRAIGYSLTGSTMEQCLFILHGPTKTGKSTFLARLKALLGPYSTQADMESFMHKDKAEIRNDLADLAGARVVCALEAQEGKRLNESLIKQLTGGVDQVKARFLFQDYFTYTPQFKVFLGTNHKPVIKDNDQAIWERIRLVPFVVQIPPGDRKKDFDATLHTEIEGILAWAVQGCLDWQKLGDLKPPPEVIAATAGYQKEMDIIGRFLEEKCQVERNEKLQAKELYDAYKAWCEDNGERWDTQTTFGKKMGERGIEKKPGHVVMYQDITWKKPPAKPAEAPSEDADVPC